MSQKPRMKFPKLKMTITKSEGYCYHDYKVGDEFILEDFTHPPKFFCAGIYQSAFPAAYALTFGAEFPFQDNVYSLTTTCPDGGKMEFKTEVLDDDGKVKFKPKPKDYKPKPKKLIIEVYKNKGGCFYGYKEGDKFEVTGLRTPPGFCGAAYHMMFPALFALNFGASFPFMDPPNSINTATCPDKGKIVFKITRQNEDTTYGMK